MGWRGRANKGRGLNGYGDRIYRRLPTPKDLSGFGVRVRETDLWVEAESRLEKETRDLVFEARRELEEYIGLYPEFATTLSPFGPDRTAPPLVSEMIRAAEKARVGPMAAVAGAIAEYVGRGLLRWSPRVMVENGGDIFLCMDREVTVTIYAGDSPISGKIGLVISREMMPAGICSSSGTVGHSLSMGKADAVCVLAPSAALADGMATAAGNRIRGPSDLEEAVAWASGVEGVSGVVAIVGKSMAAWGEMELVRL